jgi:glycopeptide antibiotics resistance protein
MTVFKSAGYAAPSRAGRSVPERHGTLAWATLLYMVAVTYASIIPFDYAPLALSDAVDRFLHIQYLKMGSDQEADWMANLLMFVPLGFLTLGAVWPRDGTARRIFAAFAALAVCLLFLLGVKFLQLYFPPRTVTLNYIVAQSIGSAVGAVLWAGLHPVLPSFRKALQSGGSGAIRALLLVYLAAFVFAILFPFNIVATQADWSAKLHALPSQLFGGPGVGRPLIERLAIFGGQVVAAMPIGALLSVLPSGRARRPAEAFLLGAGWGFAVLIAHLFIIDGQSHLYSLATNALGFWLGAVAVRSLRRADPIRLLRRLQVLVPFLVLPYLVAVVAVNDLTRPEWRTVEQAIQAVDWRGIYPFWHHYIVSKSQALLSTAVHVVMYAPIGVLVWAYRAGPSSGGARTAALLAAILAAVVEIARQFKPGLQIDVANVIIGSLAAAGAFALSSLLWRWFAFPPAARRLEPEAAAGSKAAPAPKVEPRPAGSARPGFAPWRVALAALLLALASVVVAEYPVHPAVLAACLFAYAVLLWFRPYAWLVVVPFVLPALDFAPWTGWLYVQEPDLFVLVTLGILLLRGQPTRGDLNFGGGPAAFVLLLSIIAYLVSGGLGLTHLPGVPDVSDNPYLDAHNALRLAKGFAVPLVLLPFLGHAFRSRSNAFTLLGVGMILGLSAVCGAAFLERYLFTPDVFDLSFDYRIAATFSSMHLGGGHIGAYLAMALPFLAIGFDPPRNVLRVLLSLAIVVVAGFTLLTTFSRTDVVAGVLAVLVLTVGYAAALSPRRTHPGLGRVLILVGGGAVAAALVAADLSSMFMQQRLSHIWPDLALREKNWASGLAVRERSMIGTFFGSGLGSYPRIYAARNFDDVAPERFAVHDENGQTFLALGSGQPIYLGQKVAVVPGQTYQFSVALRFAAANNELNIPICEKWLLYSIRCRGFTIRSRTPGRWETFSAALDSDHLGDSGHGSWLRRPVELAFWRPSGQDVVDIRDVRLIDPAGRNLVANPDFRDGMERWLFTDDYHLSWRMKNQYLMILFEQGVFGLLAFVLLAGASLVSAARACLAGRREAAIVGAGIVSFLASGVFDYLTEAPRLATLFYLLCFTAFWIEARPLSPKRAGIPGRSRRAETPEFRSATRRGAHRGR